MIQELAVNLEYSEKQNDIFFPESSYPKFTIVPKGRRAGLTNGAAHAFIEYGLSGDNDYWFLPKGDLYFLWGDTISTNIDKYIERYFLPVIKTLPESLFTWKKQEKLVKIGRATIDFRSADRPENWEGFGYHFIFLNEAGIILENDYLYDNAVLPMLMDYEFSRLIAAGVPKGKRTRFGIHKFHTLYEKAKNGDKDYRLIQLTGYDNPFIHRESIDLVASTLDDATKRQEIDGEFIDVNEQAYLYAFKESKHVIPEYTPNPHLPILISFDFNKEPMTATVSQKIDLHNTVTFDELQIHDGSTPEMCEMILAKYIKFLHNMDVTGDATGRNRSAMTRGNLNHYRIIKDMLQLKDRNILVPKQNMAHKDSRVLCNSVLQNSGFKITKNCTELIRDMIYASVDEKGELIKTQAEGRHFFDNGRYTIHTCYPDFIKRPEIYR